MPSWGSEQADRDGSGSLRVAAAGTKGGNASEAHQHLECSTHAAQLPNRAWSAERNERVVYMRSPGLVADACLETIIALVDEISPARRR